jgi:lysozyme family protein
MDRIPREMLDKLSLLPGNFMGKGLLQPAIPDINKEFEYYSKNIYPTIKEAEGGFQEKQNDRRNWTGQQVGKGVLVGTNMGVTPLALGRYLSVDPSKITQKMIREVTPDMAKKIFFEQYYIEDGINKVPDEIKPILGNIAVLRPSAAKAARNATNKKDAVNKIIEDFSKMDRQADVYKENIRGWINRIHRVAGMETFENRSDMFRKYPKLRPIPVPGRKPRS